MKGSLSLTVVVVVAVAGCAARLPPPLLVEAGITTASSTVQKEIVTTFEASAGRGGSRVMHIGWDEATGALRVVTEHGIRWMAADGTRDVTFPRPMFRAAVIRRDDGELRIAGFSGGDDVPLMTLEGRIETVLDGASYTLPLVADVAGDRGAELLLPTSTGMTLHDGAGRSIGFTPAPRYASNRTVVQADEDPELEIAFVSTRPARPSLEVHVANADGSPVAGWTREDVAWLSSVPALGHQLLWGVTSRGFTAWDAAGRERVTYPAAGIGHMRDVFGARIGRHVALVASGNGYRGRSVISIYDQDRQLVYQEVLDGMSYALAADAGAGAFLVGAGNRVYRFTTPH